MTSGHDDVAYQGEPGAYSEAAALRFRPGAAARPCPTFEEVFQTVAEGRATYGVLPVENSVGGSVHRNYDLLLEHNLPIVAEVELRVVHCLLAVPGTTLPDVRRIYSHPQALAQCDRFLRSLEGVEVVATYDTAGSAKLLRDQRLHDAAAIASERAGAVFGLSVLRSGIEDFAGNITRFIVVARTDTTPPEATDKTTLVFAVKSVPGALFTALSVFADRGIDLTKLESRPLRGRPWEYLFYVDLTIGADDSRLADAMAALPASTTSVRRLGSYPSARASALAAETG